MKIIIIKYPAGNIRSLIFILERMGIKPLVSDDIDLIIHADKVIIPGVGEAKSAMNYFYKKGLDKIIPFLKQPVLGICLGMQLFCKFSEESNTTCLGIFDLEVKKLNDFNNNYKIPQIGWNSISCLRGDLFAGINDEVFQYFIHSYYVPINKYTIAKTNYIIDYSAALQHENFFATQFHPEKSSSIGKRILKNFLKKK